MVEQDNDGSRAQVPEGGGNAAPQHQGMEAGGGPGVANQGQPEPLAQGQQGTRYVSAEVAQRIRNMFLSQDDGANQRRRAASAARSDNLTKDLETQAKFGQLMQTVTDNMAQRPDGGQEILAKMEQLRVDMDRFKAAQEESLSSRSSEVTSDGSSGSSVGGRSRKDQFEQQKLQEQQDLILAQQEQLEALKEAAELQRRRHDQEMRAELLRKKEEMLAAKEQEMATQTATIRAQWMSLNDQLDRLEKDGNMTQP